MGFYNSSWLNFNARIPPISLLRCKEKKKKKEINKTLLPKGNSTGVSERCALNSLIFLLL